MIKRLAIALFCATTVYAADIYVDYNTGKEHNSGSKDSPLPTFHHALEKVKPGDTVYILPSDKPIRDHISICNLSGTPDAPVTVDGMNNIFLGTVPVTPEDWREVSPGLTRNHSAPGRKWPSRFPLPCDGRINRMGRLQKAAASGKSLKKPAELAPGEWTVVIGRQVPSKEPHPHFETEYFVRLPEGRQLENSGVEEPLVEKPSGVLIDGKVSHIVLRNMIVRNFINDGYNIHGECTGIHFENIAAVDCGDDAVSAHEKCSISVKNLVAIGCSTVVCHVQEAVAAHENVYAERISGRELYLTAGTNNTFRNIYMFADSFSGSLWMTGKAHDRQKGRVENLYMIYNNPRAVFAEKHRGVADIKYANVQIAGTEQVMKRDGIHLVEPDAIRGRIETARKDLFALFGGNLEKAL